MWSRAIQALKRQVKQNEMLSAGIWMSALAGTAGGCYVLIGHGMDMASRAIVSTVSVRNREEAFEWVTDWVGEHSGSFVTANRLQLKVAQNNSTVNPYRNSTPGGLQYEPGLGTHIFTYNNKLIILHREARETITSGFDRQPYTPETIRLWCVGGSGTLRDFLSECRELSIEKEKGKTPLYFPDHGDWRKVAMKPKRKKDSIILKDGQLDSVLHDVENFLKSEEKYTKLGVPYRRGYLFHGPPGCGKTSLVAGIAGCLGLGVSSISLNTRGLDDTGLSALLRDSPEKCILLLEDIDSIFQNRVGGDETAVTFSGLLNAVDGVASQEGRVLVMTTNHVESLDPALLRPGRCDVKVHLTNATSYQASAMLTRFIPTATPEEATIFSDHIESRSVSMAAIQAYLLKNNTIADCINNLDSIECGETPCRSSI